MMSWIKRNRQGTGPAPPNRPTVRSNGRVTQHAAPLCPLANAALNLARSKLKVSSLRDVGESSQAFVRTVAVVVRPAESLQREWRWQIRLWFIIRALLYPRLRKWLPIPTPPRHMVIQAQMHSADMLAAVRTDGSVPISVVPP